MIPSSEIVKDEYKKLSGIFKDVMKELPFKKIVKDIIIILKLMRLQII